MTPPAHPRSRGENLLLRLRGWRSRGSSPLTRGKLIPVDLGDVPEGLIPAHAGKTWNLWLAVSHMAAHPRSRGENLVLNTKGSDAEGSSPLTRGKLGVGGDGLTCDRLIPAHAGKTDSGGGVKTERGAHPRSRGENDQRCGEVPKFVGSSPLTRGKLLGAGQYAVHDRLIPAHAGKTHVRSVDEEARSAHPRSRGENSGTRDAGPGTGGSSPLTRGKRIHPYTIRARGRLIPAHAGKTGQQPNSRPQPRAHPRSRGENVTS